MQSHRTVLITRSCPPYRTRLFNVLHQETGVQVVLFSNTPDDRANLEEGVMLPAHVSVFPKKLPQNTRVVVVSFPEAVLEATYLAQLCARRTLGVWCEEWYQPKGILRFCAGLAYKWVANQAALGLVPGSRHAAHLAELGLSPEKIYVAPNAVPVPGWVSARHGKSQDTDEFRIVFIGRFVKEKGLETLVAAARLLGKRKGLRIVIAGEGDMLIGLRRVASSLGTDTLQVVSPLHEREKWLLLLASDMLVLPSQPLFNYSEAWGLVVNEAAHCHVGSIVTDVVGCAGDLVIDGLTGIVIPPNSARALAHAIEEIASNPQQARRLGEAAYERVRRLYSMEVSVSNWVRAINLLEETVNP